MLHSTVVAPRIHAAPVFLCLISDLPYSMNAEKLEFAVNFESVNVKLHAKNDSLYHIEHWYRSNALRLKKQVPAKKNLLSMSGSRITEKLKTRTDEEDLGS